MKFYTISEICQKLENEPSRLEKKNILSDIFASHPIVDIKKIIYFLCTLINNNENILYLNEIQLINYISEYYTLEKKDIIKNIKHFGDLSLFIKHLPNVHPTYKQEATTDKVITTLETIQKIEGKNSIEQKKKLLFQLWDTLPNNEICYLIKFITNKLRIGLTHKTILDLLYDICRSKENMIISKEFLEKQYGINGDIGYITEKILTEDIEGLCAIQPKCGKYIQSQSAEVYFKDKMTLDFTHDIFITQPKLDGFRLQIHIAESIILFSRNGMNVTHMYPDIVRNSILFKKKNNIKNGIFDGELIGYNFAEPSFLSFQETAKRKRIHNIENNEALCELRYIIFDILLINDISLINSSYQERLKQLEDFLYDNRISLINSTIVKNYEGLEKIYKEIGSHYEGIMIKKGSSLCEPGKRSRSWLKYKNIQKDSMEDTIDLVILGYKVAKGNKKSRQKIGSLLVGHYNTKKDQFESVAQVGSGGDTILWTDLEEMLAPFIISDIPSNVLINKKHMPDIILNPTIVISIKADCVTVSKEHTSGLSVRFPRLICIRKDKNKFQTHIPIIQ